MAIQKNKLAVAIVSHVKILISRHIIICLILQKMMLWAQKSTFLSSDFFVKNLSFYYHLKAYQIVLKNGLVAAFLKLLSFLFLP